MEIYVVRLNADTRDCLPYSKYSNKNEREEKRKSSTMNGFHEAVNFLPEHGIVRGYLPPKHLKGLRESESFLLVTVTAKGEAVGGNKVIGIQAGCKYKGETTRNLPERGSDKISWHYFCPESLSVLLPSPINNARDLILEEGRKWGQGPTYKIGLKTLKKIIVAINGDPKNKEIKRQIEVVAKVASGEYIFEESIIESESSFEQEVIEALLGDLSNVQGNKLPQQREVKSLQYVRDARVVAFALKRANGKCEKCGASPFKSKATGMPYLEVHHKITLKSGGPDTIDNVIALCPNCHREHHYG